MKKRVRLLSDYSLLIVLLVAAAIATAVSVWMVVELDPQTVADPKDRHSMQWFFIVVGAIYDIATITLAGISMGISSAWEKTCIISSFPDDGCPRMSCIR